MPRSRSRWGSESATGSRRRPPRRLTRRALGRARPLRAAGCLLLAVAAAGCGAAGATSNVTATGKTLTIYAGPPGSGGQAAQDVIDAERLALSQAGDKAGSFSV